MAEGAHREVPHPAVARLAEDSAMMLRMLAERWPLVAEALTAGAGAQLVAAACGLDVTDLRRGLGVWATHQWRAGLINLDEYQRLCVLALGDAGPVPAAG